MLTWCIDQWLHGLALSSCWQWNFFLEVASARREWWSAIGYYYYNIMYRHYYLCPYSWPQTIYRSKLNHTNIIFALLSHQQGACTVKFLFKYIATHGIDHWQTYIFDMALAISTSFSERSFGSIQSERWFPGTPVKH